MRFLKWIVWDIQPWEQKVMTIVAVFGLTACSMYGWIRMFGG